MLFFTNNIVSEHKKQSQQYGIELIEYGSELLSIHYHIFQDEKNTRIVQTDDDRRTDFA